MIKPTIGRVVWFWASIADRQDNRQPYAAIIAHVHTDFNVNLMVINTIGNAEGYTSVPLFQGEQHGAIPDRGPFCEWMPFQKGQAPASSAIEARVASLEQANQHNVQLR